MLHTWIRHPQAITRLPSADIPPVMFWHTPWVFTIPNPSAVPTRPVSYHPEIDALIDKVKATLDPEENLKVVTELSKALNDTCTQVPIYLKNNVRAYAKGLEGFKMSPSGGMYISELSWSE